MSVAAAALTAAFDIKVVEKWCKEREDWHHTHVGVNIYAEPSPGTCIGL
jgi:hypothetical protein